MCIKVSGKLTVYFEPPFWVGLFEEEFEDTVAYCRVVFGQEPKDYEVYAFILEQYDHLKFSKPIPINQVHTKARINPKRMQRLVKKQVQNKGIGTKAQQALKANYETEKKLRKRLSKSERDRLADEKYQLKVAKRKLKKKGH